MAAGNNIRYAGELPIPMTRRMSHWFALTAPSLGFHEAFLFALVRGLGGTEELFHALRTEWGAWAGAPDLIREVIRFFVREAAPDVLLSAWTSEKRASASACMVRTL